MLDDARNAAIGAWLSPTAVHGCLLLVHPEIARLEAEEQALHSSHDWPRILLNRDSAAQLRFVPPAARSGRARAWLDEQAALHAPGQILCSGIDLLFESALGLEPLGLLLGCARRARLVVL